MRRGAVAVVLAAGTLFLGPALPGARAFSLSPPASAQALRAAGSSRAYSPSAAPVLCRPEAVPRRARQLRMTALADSWSPPEGKIKGVLFDIDGTLFDSDPVHFEVFQELLAKEGINGVGVRFPSLHVYISR